MQKQFSRTICLLIVVVFLCASNLPAISAQESYAVITAKNAESLTEVGALEADAGAVRMIDFNADGTLLASGHEDSTVHIWDIAEQDAIDELNASPDGLEGQEQGVLYVGFGPDSMLMSTAADTMMSKAILIWDVETGKSTSVGTKNFMVMGINVELAALSSDGKVIAQTICGSEIGVTTEMDMFCYEEGVRFVDVESEEIISTFEPSIKDGIRAITFSPDGTLLAVVGADNDVYLLDVKTAKVKRTLPNLNIEPTGAAFSPDSKLIAVGAINGSVKVYNAKTGAALQTMKGGKAAVVAVAFNADSTVLASAGADGLVRLWDIKTKQEQVALEGHTDTIITLAFNPEGTLLASGSLDETIRLWGITND